MDFQSLNLAFLVAHGDKMGGSHSTVRQYLMGSNA